MSDLLSRFLDIVLGPPQFVIGDVVRLRGGGPPMTVERIEGDWISTCWFVGFELHRSTFEPPHLLMVTPMVRAKALIDEGQKEADDSSESDRVRQPDGLSLGPKMSGGERKASHGCLAEGSSSEGDGPFAFWTPPA